MMRLSWKRDKETKDVTNLLGESVAASRDVVEQLEKLARTLQESLTEYDNDSHE